jgi:hypothetical protein
MNLVEAKSVFEAASDENRLSDRSPTDRWNDFPHSELSHHGAACCDIAREWLRAMDFAQLNGAQLSSGPRWLRAKYKWGPSEWPMHWCDVVERETIDCGAHAALSRDVFQARGMTAFPAQLVQQFDEQATTQWRAKWSGEGVSCHWLDDTHIYHEVTAVLFDGGELKLWDASSATWIDSRQAHAGYGSVTALRIIVDQAAGVDELFWGDRRIVPNVWNAQPSRLQTG